VLRTFWYAGTFNQRVLNDSQRTRLSRSPMNWLHLHPLHPSQVGKVDRQHSERLRKRDNLLKVNGGLGGGGGVKSVEIMRRREKTLSSINHSILSAFDRYITFHK
jgi:hypothetical protein